MSDLIPENPSLTPIFNQIKTIIPYTHVAILYLEEEAVSLIGYRGPLSYAQASMINFDLADSAFLQQVYQGREPVLIKDILDDTPISQAHRSSVKVIFPNDPLSYIKSWIGLPLRICEQYSVFIDVAHKERHYYSEKDVLLLQQYIESVAITIENVVLSAVHTRRSAKSQALLAIQQAIFCHLEICDVLQLVADQARQLTSAQKITIFLLDGTTLSALCESGDIFAGVQPVHKLPFYGSLIGETIRTNVSLRRPSLPDEPHAHSDEALLFGRHPFLIIPLLTNDLPIGALVAIGKGPGYYGPDDERILTMLAAGAAIAVENARLYHEEQKKRRVAEEMQKILTQLSFRQLLDENLNNILLCAIQLLEADAGHIYCTQPGINRTSLIATSGLDEEFLKILRSPTCWRSFRETGLQDATVYGLYLLSAEKEPPDRGSSIPGTFKTALRAPLGFNGDVFGMFDIFWGEPQNIPPDRLQLAETIAKHVRLAIERDWLSKKSEEVTRLKEQQRIAQALHDTVAQFLFRIGLEAKWCYQHLTMEQAGIEHLQTIQRLVERSNHELRSAIFALRNRDFGGDNNFVDLLKDQLNEFQNECGIETTLVVSPGLKPLPPQVTDALYRILREGLANIRKHAGASAVLVSLYSDNHRVTITIQDNGLGLPDLLFDVIDPKKHFEHGSESLELRRKVP